MHPVYSLKLFEQIAQLLSHFGLDARLSRYFKGPVLYLLNARD